MVHITVGGGGGSNINDKRPAWEKQLDASITAYYDWLLMMESKENAR